MLNIFRNDIAKTNFWSLLKLVRSYFRSCKIGKKIVYYIILSFTMKVTACAQQVCKILISQNSVTNPLNFLVSNSRALNAKEALNKVR